MNTLHLLKGQVSEFLSHTYIERQQQKFFEEEKENTNERAVSLCK